MAIYILYIYTVYVILFIILYTRYTIVNIICTSRYSCDAAMVRDAICIHIHRATYETPVEYVDVLCWILGNNAKHVNNHDCAHAACAQMCVCSAKLRHRGGIHRKFWTLVVRMCYKSAHTRTHKLILNILHFYICITLHLHAPVRTHTHTHSCSAHVNENLAFNVEILHLNSCTRAISAGCDAFAVSQRHWACAEIKNFAWKTNFHCWSTNHCFSTGCFVVRRSYMYIYI